MARWPETAAGSESTARSETEASRDLGDRPCQLFQVATRTVSKSLTSADFQRSIDTTTGLPSNRIRGSPGMPEVSQDLVVALEYVRPLHREAVRLNLRNFFTSDCELFGRFDAHFDAATGSAQ